ncbi:3-isopropylmalate dehydratase small subunit [Hypnocyclicus thermotrophus]|uniref:3-isopropylmalate dehydratase small subunit n=1 Tax=Hypnocyclicus thermotrophus TaxID=1627895 RepID=A0AA46I5L0_9FUSO|nr:3-isopropylmalate dehydratase [Hypnocyclicus thermotrophus]TDT70448.1 3-isopropylmalate dehydratase small subunit [Hypnocyclicus thermotrophus]
MEKIIKGKVYVLGDNIDTDQIIPAMHLVYKTDDPEESKLYGKYAMSGLPLDIAEKQPFIKGDAYISEYQIMVVGNNFGCGSSREHAPLALQKAGIKAVVAKDYARIFYRNSVDGGFLVPFESKEKIDSFFDTGDEAEIDLENAIIKNITKNKEYKLNSLGDVANIIEAGGLFNYAQKKGFIK